MALVTKFKKGELKFQILLFAFPLTTTTKIPRGKRGDNFLHILNILGGKKSLEKSWLKGRLTDPAVISSVVLSGKRTMSHN